MQQRVYQITLRNVYEFKEQLVKSGLVWNKTLSTLLSMNGESISVPVFAQLANISINFTASSWRIKQLDKCQSECQKCEQMCFVRYLE